MADSENTLSNLDPAAVADFHDTLEKSKRIIAVIGAGLSASSGLAVFRGTSGLWKNQDVMQVASPAGFCHDPGLVWQFYSYRRQEALKADPNPAHYALAELARKLPGFVALTQNVDNLSPRAGHPPGQMKELHGNLFTLTCVDKIGCGHVERNFEQRLTPALDPSKDEKETIGSIDAENRPRASPLLLAGIAKKHAQILGDKYQDNTPTTRDLTSLKPPEEPTTAPVAGARLSSGLTKEDLPQCPKCKANILRPGVVWFGEPLPLDVVKETEALFEDPEPIDLCLTIGTSSRGQSFFLGKLVFQLVRSKMSLKDMRVLERFVKIEPAREGDAMALAQIQMDWPVETTSMEDDPAPRSLGNLVKQLKESL